MIFIYSNRAPLWGNIFTPSYANLAMAFWKTNFVWRQNPFPAHIVLFGRYIDDIVIWDRSPDLISQFVNYCNYNLYGLSFTFVTDPNTLAFLDFENCHYPKWIQNIPKGQFCRLRQNCTWDINYVEQSVALKKKFLDKKYAEKLIDQAFEFLSKGKTFQNGSQIWSFHQIHDYLPFPI